MEFLGILFFAIGVADGVLAFTLSQSIKREKEDYEKLQEESLEWWFVQKAKEDWEFDRGSYILFCRL